MAQGDCKIASPEMVMEPVGLMFIFMTLKRGEEMKAMMSESSMEVSGFVTMTLT